MSHKTIPIKPERSSSYEHHYKYLGRVLSFAPGEGNRPLGQFMDKDSELLAIPTILYVKTRPDTKDRKIPVHYSTVCKWELRS